VSFTEGEKDIPKGDYVLLEIKTAKGASSTHAMRPDEAIIVIEKLAAGLYRMVSGYHMGLLRKKRKHAEQRRDSRRRRRA
jgi:hypothetical protein